MTPQQANELLRAALKEISETLFGWDGDCGVTSIADDALEATADCAPAPTEPAVDRKPDFSKFATLDDYRAAVAQWEAGGASQVDALAARLQKMGVTRFGFTPGDNATPEKVAGEIMRALDEIEDIATPASPAVPPITPKHIEEIKDLLLWPVTEDDARAARDMLQSLHFDLSMVEPAPAPLAPESEEPEVKKPTGGQTAPGIVTATTATTAGSPAISGASQWATDPAPQVPQASQPTSAGGKDSEQGVAK